MKESFDMEQLNYQYKTVKQGEQTQATKYVILPDGSMAKIPVGMSQFEYVKMLRETSH